MNINNSLLIKKPLNDEDANREVRKMTSFILQEAKEKANEIKVRADEEYNMEKAKIFKSEKQLIEESFNKKMRQAELKSKILYSHAVNKSRIIILSEKEKCIGIVLENVRKELKSIYQVKDQKIEILNSLIDQCLQIYKGQNQLKIECLLTDQDEIQKILKAKDINSEVEFKNLPCDFIGGLKFIYENDKITCDNSLNERIFQIIEQYMPLIRLRLFKK